MIKEKKVKVSKANSAPEEHFIMRKFSVYMFTYIQISENPRFSPKESHIYHIHNQYNFYYFL